MKKVLNVLTLAGLVLPAAQAALVAGDFSAGITSTTSPWLTSSEIDDGWFSHDASFLGGSGVATTDSGQANGHIVAQVFSNAQSGLVSLSFDWTPAGSEELNFAVYGYNNESGNMIYLNPQFSNSGPVTSGAGGGTILLSTFPPVTGNGVTGTTTTAPFDVTGYNQLGIAFWQRTSANGSVLDNVAITAIPEPSSALVGGLGLLALLRRRRA